MKTKKPLKNNEGLFQKNTQLRLEEAWNKVLQWFFSYPDTPISLSDLAEQLEISKSTASRIVNDLISINFLEREILGKLWRLTCNKNHSFNFSKKISNNLKVIYESGLVDDIKRRFPESRAIILFGSYRKGDDTEKSDIDIAIEVVDNEELRIFEHDRFTNFSYRKDVPVHLHIFSRNKIDLNLFANIANGIVLEGFLEVRP